MGTKRLIITSLVSASLFNLHFSPNFLGGITVGCASCKQKMEQKKEKKWWRGKEWWRGQANISGVSHPHLGAQLSLDDGKPILGMIIDPTPARLSSSPPFISCIDCNPGIEGEAGNAALHKIRGGIERYKNGTNAGRRGGRRRSRILCMVYTVHLPGQRANLRAIAETWAPRCDGFIAASNSTDHSVGAIDLLHLGQEEYGNMWQKVRAMWTYAYDHYLDEYDFFHICGDDVYLVVDNLRSFVDGPDVERLEEGYLDEISRVEPYRWRARKWGGYRNGSRPLIFGIPMSHYKEGEIHIFPAGGPGYTLNSAALDLFGRVGADSFFAKYTNSREDVLIGSFFQFQGVALSHTMDRSNGVRYGGSAENMARWHWGVPSPTGPKLWAEHFGLRAGDYLDGVSEEYVAFHLKDDKVRLENNRTIAELISRYHHILYCIQ